MGATLGSGVKGSDPGVRGRGTPGFGPRAGGGDLGFRFLPHPPPPRVVGVAGSRLGSWGQSFQSWGRGHGGQEFGSRVWVGGSRARGVAGSRGQGPRGCQWGQRSNLRESGRGLRGRVEAGSGRLMNIHKASLACVAGLRAEPEGCMAGGGEAHEYSSGLINIRDIAQASGAGWVVGAS